MSSPTVNPFVYNAMPARVVFEQGSRRQVANEVEQLGRGRALVVCTAGRRAQGDEIAGLLGDKCAGVLDTAVLHTPVEVSEHALKVAQKLDADCTVAVGGGSPIGLAKALAVRADLPQIAIPTTYAGSEMTNVLGQTENGLKTTFKDARVLPRTVLYDVDYTMSLPADISAVSGLNALAHAVEALYAQEKNPITDMQALQAIAALVDALPRIADNPSDVEARSNALFGAFVCSLTLGSVSISLHHKLCHTLGGTFGLDHAQTHAVVLPHAAGYNEHSPNDPLAPVRTILKTKTVGGGLWDLAKRIGAPINLADIGMPKDGLEKAADLATSVNPYWNPRSFDKPAVLALLNAAYRGERPT